MPLIACAAGAVAGLLYTLSPMTVWFGIAIVAVFRWAGAGICGRERTWLFCVLGCAVLLRLLVLAAFFLLTYSGDSSFPVLIPDETYIAFRARLVRDTALQVPFAPGDYGESVNQYGESGLHEILAYTQLLLGTAPYGIRLLNVVLFLVAGVTLYRTTRVSFGGGVALGGLAVLLFLPSLFVWSISTLKETPFHFLTATAVGAAVLALRTERPRARVFAILVAVIAVYVLGRVRGGGDIMVGGGILAGLTAAALVRRPATLLVSLPLFAAIGAYAIQSPVVAQRLTNITAAAATVHIGHVHTPGRAYKLLDADFYTRRADGSPPGIDTDRLTLPSSLRYIIRAFVSFLLVPLPWMIASNSMLAYLPELVIWYVLLALAVAGVVAGMRRDAALTLVLLAAILIGAGVIGMTSGNIGTLVRHRGMVMVLVPWLSALGAYTLFEQVTGRARLRPYPAAASHAGA